MKKILNKKISSGITLIALTITIVVLIILAGVAINLSLGENGLFKKAKTATEEYTNAQKTEETEIAKSTNEIDGYVDSNRGTLTISEEEYNELINRIKNLEDSSYKETVLYEGAASSGNITFANGHKADEFDALIFLYGLSNSGLYNYDSRVFQVSNWIYMINNHKNVGDVLGLYGYDNRYINIKNMSLTGFTINNQSGSLVITRILGVNY